MKKNFIFLIIMINVFSVSFLCSAEKNKSFSLIASSDNTLDGFDHPHSINGLGLNLQTNIFPWLYLDVTFQMLLDRTNPDAFLPYTYSKSWDHHHMDVEDRVDKSYEEFAISNRSQSEITIHSADYQNYIRFGRFRKDWGPGDYSFILSSTARPFNAVETGFKLKEWGYIDSILGSLGKTCSKETKEEQKMIAAHKLTLTPFDWLSLSVWEAVIFGKRFELCYISPVSIYFASQMGTTGDKDNSMMGFDIELFPLDSLKLYGSLYIDEIEHDKMDELFTNPKNMFAYYAGLKQEIPFIPSGELTFQYTKLEPFVYTHYKQEYNGYKEKININYTHDGENIGYPLPPNSDEFKLRFVFRLAQSISVDSLITYVRHGDNPGKEGYHIYGDIDKPLDYSKLKKYPRKNFLHDGIYEKTLSFSGKVTYDNPEKYYGFYGGAGVAFIKNYHNIEDNDKTKFSMTFGGTYKLPLF